MFEAGRGRQLGRLEQQSLVNHQQAGLNISLALTLHTSTELDPGLLQVTQHLVL